jgi:DNA-binding response OmpR family regulator
MKKRILIVEADREIVKELQDALGVVWSRDEMVIDVVHDGAHALSLLNHETFDAIVLDILLPKQDGFQVLAQLNKRGVETPVLILSHLAHVDDAAYAKQLGAHDFLLKASTQPADVAAYLRTLLN